MIADAKRVAQRQRKQIHDLEKDRDHLKAKAIELSTKLHQAEEEVKIRDLHILDKKKKLQETRIKLKQRHLLYEQVRAVDGWVGGWVLLVTFGWVAGWMGLLGSWCLNGEQCLVPSFPRGGGSGGIRVCLGARG